MSVIPSIDFNPMLSDVPMGHISMIDGLRDQHDAFRSNLGPGFWVLTRLADIRAAYQTPELFSSSAIMPIDPDPQYMLVPEMLDPPVHTMWRQFLAPHFSPAAIAKMEGPIRRRCIELIEPLAEAGGCEFNADFSYRFPPSIFLELMGLPIEDLPQFQYWNDEIHHIPLDVDPAKARMIAAQNEVMVYFVELMGRRRSDPRDDLVSISLTWRIDEQPIPVEDLLSMYLLMFQAGMDTVSSQLAYMWWHLAQFPDDRRRIIDDPSVVPGAVEEFLRFYAFVAPARKVMADREFAQCPMKKGDMAYLPLCSATRDREAFADADRFVIDRQGNNHIAFGAGPHRCLGSHLARRELRIALQEWHARIPDYRLVEGQTIVEHGGMFGLDSLQLIWG